MKLKICMNTGPKPLAVGGLGYFSLIFFFWSCVCVIGRGFKYSMASGPQQFGGENGLGHSGNALNGQLDLRVP